MAVVDPSRRASAGKMLDKLFNGEGRSTPRNKIQDGARLAETAALKPRLEWHPIAKPSKPHHPQKLRVRCPGCQFEGEKDAFRNEVSGLGTQVYVDSGNGITLIVSAKAKLSVLVSQAVFQDERVT